MNAAAPGSPERVPFFRRFLTICRKMTVSTATLALVAAGAVLAVGPGGVLRSGARRGGPGDGRGEPGDAVTLMRRAPQPN
jgi:hypothetical protein